MSDSKASATGDPWPWDLPVVPLTRPSVPDDSDFDPDPAEFSQEDLDYFADRAADRYERDVLGL